MCASTEKAKYGLKKGHAYAILDAKYEKDHHGILRGKVKIFNPHRPN